MLDAAVQNHAAQDVPVILMESDAADAAGLGELFYFFELAAALSAAADGLDPFRREARASADAAARLLSQGGEM